MRFPALPLTVRLSPRAKQFALWLAACVLGLACALAPVLFYLRSQEPYTRASAMTLHSISMDSADDGWAVGEISGKPTTLLMHYSRDQWTILPKPAGLDDSSGFAAVSMVSANDGWAWASMQIPIGDRYHSYRPGGVLLHYDGTAWKIATPVFPVGIGSDPSALLMLSSTEGWATGEDKTLHYDGTAWREVTDLTQRQLGGGSAIAATSSRDVWIARFTGDFVHFDGATWTDQQISAPFGQQLVPGSILLRGIAMASATEGFAVGGIGNSSSGVILQYSAGRWTVEDTVGELLYGVSLRSNGDGWAVGASGGIYRYASGQWTPVAHPSSFPLYGLSTVSAGNTYAVGTGGALLRYRDGAWQQETNVVWSKAAKDAWT